MLELTAAYGLRWDAPLRCAPVKQALGQMKHIPTEADWGDYRRSEIDPLDLDCSRKIFFGKTNKEALLMLE